MKHFFKRAEGLGEFVLAMNSLMQRQDRFSLTAADGIQELVVRESDGDKAGAKEFPELKRLSLAVMQMTNGSMLGRSILMRVDAKITLSLGNSSEFFTSYAVVLHADQGALIMAGDESVPIRTGEIWWVDLKSEAHLINKSDDEVFIMFVDVRIDP